MHCLRCGKEVESTTGGCSHCPSCGFAINDLVYRPSNCDMPLPQGFGKQVGWICPVCGRGMSPWADSCPCQSSFKITYGTTTDNNVDLSMYQEMQDSLMKTLEATEIDT